jgi:O-antigen/teichoic acid export membrane protein
MAYIAAILNYGLLAARRFPEQLMLLTGVAIVMLGACAVLIPQWGLTGAALALLCAATVNAAGAAGLLFLGSRGQQHAGQDRGALALGTDEA